jgi:hypothetical protein
MVDQQGYGGGESVQIDVISRIRSLEGKYNLLRDRALIINQNMITQYQRTTSEMKAFEEDLKEVKHNIFQIKETLKHIIREMEHFSRKEDMKVLEKYINLWNPMKFVTEDEVRKIIEESQKKRVDK